MYLYRIPCKAKSDREHRLTVSDMIEELAEYGIKAERKIRLFGYRNSS